jgi:L-alanine-DL-glutamate epimerase-like enolase superfamily enzyme
MKITELRLFELEGPPREGLAVYEIERGGLAPNQSSPYRQAFVEIETDEGVTGLAQHYKGATEEVKALGQTLIGEDPLRIEAIWDRLYTSGYQRGGNLRALSTLDLALWDLIGKAKEEPVYHLLGGPCQDRVRAYAAMLGFSTEPEAAARRTREWAAKGFSGFKWYLPTNEEEGEAGLRRNVATVAAVREAAGNEADLMFDCILSNASRNSLLYAIKLARRIEPYHPTWLEEPLNADDLEAYGRLAQATSIPLAFGEHLTTRWKFKELLDQGVATVLQPEMGITGGLTETCKIVTLAATYGVPVVPHANETCRSAMHLLFARPHRICPLAEWGVKINANVQYFYKDYYQPVDGYFELPPGPGFGYELDLSKAVRRTEL